MVAWLVKAKLDYRVMNLNLKIKVVVFKQKYSKNVATYMFMYTNKKVVFC